jgi:hypothetical protein
MASSTTLARGNVQLEAILLSPLTTPASLAANTTVELAYTIVGVALGDFIEINKPSHVVGLSIGNVRVSAQNTVAIQWVNNTAGTITGGLTENYLLVVSRFDGFPQNPPAALV